MNGATAAAGIAAMIGDYVKAGATKVVLEPAPGDSDVAAFVRLIAEEVQPLVD